MTKLQTGLILTTAFVAMAVIAPYAFADSLNQSGVGNIANQNSNNGNNSGVIYSGTGAGGNVTASGGDAHATGGTAIAAPITHNTNIAGGAESSASTGAVSVDSPVTVSTKVPRQTASAYAPGLTNSFGNDSCLGSATGGISTSVFGASLGGSTVDENCQMLKNSERADRKGFHKAALYILCENPKFREGMQFEGTKCPQDEQQEGRRLGALSPAAKGTEFPLDKKRFE